MKQQVTVWQNVLCTSSAGCYTPAQVSNSRSARPREGTGDVDWNQEALMALRVVLAAVLGGFIGWEREWHAREAGVRTYAAVSLGSCVFALLSTHVTTGNNPHVIAAGVGTGIGFLRGGGLLRGRGNIVGLTTAATLWATASVGLATGYGMYTLAVLVALIVFGLLALHHVPGWGRLKQSNPLPPSLNQEPSAPSAPDREEQLR